MAKTLTMRLDDATYETFLRAARAERRSLANLVETAALRQIERAASSMMPKWPKSCRAPSW